MDSLFLYIESNAIFIVLLSVLLFHLRDASKLARDEKLFKITLMLNIVVLIADTGCWIFDGRIFGGTLLFNKLVYAVYYIVTILFAFSWTVYAGYRLNPNWNRRSKFLYVSAIPVILAVILSIVSIGNGYFFFFDERGSYHRGTLFSLHTVLLLFYIILSVAIAFKKLYESDKRESRREAVAVLGFLVFPLVGGILQTLFYGLNLAWTGSSVALLIVFISIQNRQISTDALTGIYNRGYFSKYLQSILSNLEKGDKWYLLVVDVDSFKSINDNYGHTMGDAALVTVVKALKRACDKSKELSLLARYGGDEFVILWRKSGGEEVEILAENIGKEIDIVNKKAELPFNLSVSLGWAEYDSEEYFTAEKFVAAADTEMYKNKRNARS